MGCTLADEVGHLGHSKEVEASFDMGEEDSQGNLMGVHMLGDMAADNSLIMAIIEVKWSAFEFFYGSFIFINYFWLRVNFCYSDWSYVFYYYVSFTFHFIIFINSIHSLYFPPVFIQPIKVLILSLTHPPIPYLRHHVLPKFSEEYINKTQQPLHN